MKGRISVDGGHALLPIQEEVLESIREEAGRRVRRQYLEAERRILAGEDRVELPYLPGTTDARSIVFSVPPWSSLRSRLRVEWARAKWRYRERQERWGGQAPAAMQLKLVSGDPPDTLELTGCHTTDSAYAVLCRWRDEMRLAHRPIGSTITCRYRGPDGIERTVRTPA